jgi:hypothetical protein
LAKAVTKRKTKKSDAQQSERFKETARKLGADDVGELFEKTFKKIVPPKTKTK